MSYVSCSSPSGSLASWGGAMAIEDHDLPECLVTSVGLRCPVFERGTPPRERVEALEEYLLLSAWTQGALAEQRLDYLAHLVPLEHEWDAIVVPKERLRTKTEKAVEEAKRQINPTLHGSLTIIRWMVKRLDEEIARMEKDAGVCSRAYAMVTGS